MPIVLLRVDERLVHGQVVIGWGVPLHAERVVVVDDLLAVSPWEQELYSLGIPPEMEAEFTSVEDAARRIAGWRRSPKRIILLVRDVATLGRLASSLSPSDGEINLGGVHHAPGRSEALPYLFLNPDERSQLAMLAGQGISISARDLPASRRVPLEEILRDE